MRVSGAPLGFHSVALAKSGPSAAASTSTFHTPATQSPFASLTGVTDSQGHLAVIDFPICATVATILDIGEKLQFTCEQPTLVRGDGNSLQRAPMTPF